MKIKTADLTVGKIADWIIADIVCAKIAIPQSGQWHIFDEDGTTAFCPSTDRAYIESLTSTEDLYAVENKAGLSGHIPYSQRWTVKGICNGVEIAMPGCTASEAVVKWFIASRRGMIIEVPEILFT